MTIMSRQDEPPEQTITLKEHADYCDFYPVTQ